MTRDRAEHFLHRWWGGHRSYRVLAPTELASFVEAQAVMSGADDETVRAVEPIRGLKLD